MKTRINKYLVGALLCAITHNGYSTEIHEERSESQKLLDKQIEIEIKKAGKYDPIKFATIKINDKDRKNLKEILTEQLAKGEKGKDDAIKTIISQLQRDWSSDLQSDANIKKIITNIFDGQQIGDTKIEIDKKGLTEANVKLINAIIQKDESLRTLAFKTLHKTVKEVSDKGGTFTNEAQMLYDDASTVTVKYMEPLNYKASTNTIDDKALGAAKIKELLENKYKDTYKFCDIALGEDIITYISNEMKTAAPTRQKVTDLIEGLYDHKFNAGDDASTAIINFLVKYQNFQDTAKAKYASAAVEIKKGKLNDQLKEINTKAGIDPKKDKIQVKPGKQTEIFRKNLNKYMKNNITSYIGDTYSTPDEKLQRQYTVTDMPTEVLVETITNIMNKNEEITREKTTLANNLEEQKKATKAKEDEATKYKIEIATKNTEVKNANDEKTKINLLLTQEKEKNKKLEEDLTKEQEKSNELASGIQLFSDYLDTLTQLGGIENAAKENDDEIPAVFSAAIDAIKDKLNGTAVDEGAGLGEEKAKEYTTEIEKLKEKINELESETKKLKDEKIDLEKKVKASAKGGVPEDSIATKDLNNKIEAFLEKYKGNGQYFGVMKDFAKQLQIDKVSNIETPKFKK